MAVSEISKSDQKTHGPARADLDKCVHCGLCLNACPTYRDLGLEADSPRGRIQQMIRISEGSPIDGNYVEHMELCLACRGCETACPSGVPYGRMIEAARADIEEQKVRSGPVRLLREFIFHRLLPSRAMLQFVGGGLYLYQASGLQRLVRFSGLLKLFGNLSRIEALAPTIEVPLYYSEIGKTYAPVGERKYRVAFLAGCIANLTFCRLNEATVRVLRRNGCEVVIPAEQTCCGALHLHSGLRTEAQELARKNLQALEDGEFDAIITNAAGCGSTLKEYEELLADDPEYAAKARDFSHRMRDITEFLASIPLNKDLAPLAYTVTYQDSCHLLHGQRIKRPPRDLLRAIPKLNFREMPNADVCCGSAGIYNVVQNEMATRILDKKMDSIRTTGADVIATANPGCMLQLRAGVSQRGSGQRVLHVVEVLDESYSLHEKSAGSA